MNFIKFYDNKFICLLNLYKKSIFECKNVKFINL